MAGEPTRNTCMPNSKFIPNMTFSPLLTTQFDSPKDQLYSPVYRPRNTIDHAAVPNMLSIQLSTPRTTASKLADQPIITDTQTDQRFNYRSSTNSQLQTTLESTPYTNRYPIEPPISFAKANSTNDILMNLDGKKKYKPVACKIKPVIAELPDKFRIIRNIIGDPLSGKLPNVVILEKISSLQSTSQSSNTNLGYNETYQYHLAYIPKSAD